jgi:type IV secretion system protein TrbL
VADADCGMLDVGCQVGNAINDALVTAAKSAAAAAAQFAGDMSTFWLSVPSPTLNADDPTVSFIQGSLYWYTSALAVLAVIVASCRIMWERRTDPGMDVLKTLIILVLINGAGLAFVSSLIYAGDQFSHWIVSRASHNFGKDLVDGLNVNDAEINITTALGLLIISCVAVIASCIQIVLLLVRNGFLVLLVGVWPTTAAATNTETGMAWFKRATGWLVAYLLYKPVSAVIYATALEAGRNAGASGGNTSINALSALTLMVMAIIALPALLRFTAPLMDKVTGGGSGAAGVAMAALPTGALALSNLGGGASSGPTGAGAATPPPPPPTGGGGAATGLALVGAGVQGVQSAANSSSGGGSSGGGSGGSGGGSGGFSGSSGSSGVPGPPPVPPAGGGTNPGAQPPPWAAGGPPPAGSTPSPRPWTRGGPPPSGSPPPPTTP